MPLMVSSNFIRCACARAAASYSFLVIGVRSEPRIRIRTSLVRAWPSQTASAQYAPGRDSFSHAHASAMFMPSIAAIAALRSASSEPPRIFEETNTFQTLGRPKMTSSLTVDTRDVRLRAMSRQLTRRGSRR